MSRPRDVRRDAYMERFELPRMIQRKYMTQKFMDQLDRCKDNEARKVLLGIEEAMSK